MSRMPGTVPWVEERLEQMAATPRMFAISRDAFLAQVELLVEFTGVPRSRIRELISAHINTDDLIQQLSEETWAPAKLDEDFAAKVIPLALAVVRC